MGKNKNIKRSQLEKPDKGRNAGKVEVLAIRDEVSEFLIQGYSMRAIYDFYHETGVLTISYATFCNHMRKLSGFSIKEQKKPVSTTNESTNSKPLVLGYNQNDSFRKSNGITQEDII